MSFADNVNIYFYLQKLLWNSTEPTSVPGGKVESKLWTCKKGN